MSSKGTYELDPVPPLTKISDIYDDESTRNVSPVTTDEKDSRLYEAIDVYGDIQTAEDYGYVSRS